MSYGKRAGLGAGLMEVGKGVGAYTQFNIEDMRQKNLDAIRKQERGEDLAARAEDNATRDRYRAEDVQFRNDDSTRRGKEVAASQQIQREQLDLEEGKMVVSNYMAIDSGARVSIDELNKQRVKIESDQTIVDPAERQRIIDSIDAREAAILNDANLRKAEYKKIYGSTLKKYGTFDAGLVSTTTTTSAPAPGVGDGSLLRLDQSDGAVPAAADKGIQSKVDARLGDTPLMSVPTAGSEDKVSAAARDLGLTLQPTTGEVIGNAASKAKDAVFGAVSAVGSKMAENRARAARNQAKIDLASAIDANGKVNRAKVESLASSGLDAASLRKIGANDKIIALIERIRAAQ